MAVCESRCVSVCTKEGYAKLGTAGAHHSTHANSLTTSSKHLFTRDFSPVLNNSESITVGEGESAWQIEAERERDGKEMNGDEVGETELRRIEKDGGGEVVAMQKKDKRLSRELRLRKGGTE